MKSHKSSPVAAGVASSILPGLGQLMTGARPVGLVLMSASALFALTLAVVLANVDSMTLLEIVTNPTLLLVLVAANAVLGLLRMVTATDAWRRAGGRWLSAGIVALLVFTAVPHIAVGYYAMETRGTLLSVFRQDAPVALGTTTTRPTTTSSTITTTTTSAEPIVAPMTIPTSTTVPTTTTTTLPLGAPRVTFLLVGTDAGPGRPGARTDAVMVATVDTTTGDAAIFGLPRNMAGFSFSDGTAFEGLPRGILNEVYMWGNRHPEKFGGRDPGITALTDVVETALDLPIDHYVMVDMVGFARLIDAIGGVTIDIPYSFSAPLYDRVTGEHETVSFVPGTRHLDGDLALAYARSRTDSSDYVRMARQRCLIGAAVDQTGPLTLARAYPQILGVFENSISTDIPLNKLPFLLNFAPRVSTDRITVVGFDTAYRTEQRTETGYPIPDFDRIREVVSSVISGADNSENGLPDIESSC